MKLRRLRSIPANKPSSWIVPYAETFKRRKKVQQVRESSCRFCACHCARTARIGGQSSDSISIQECMQSLSILGTIRWCSCTANGWIGLLNYMNWIHCSRWTKLKKKKHLHTHFGMRWRKSNERYGREKKTRDFCAVKIFLFSLIKNRHEYWAKCTDHIQVIEINNWCAELN